MGTIKRPKVSGFEPEPRQGAVVGVPFGLGKMAVWGGWNGMELGDTYILTLDSWKAGDGQVREEERQRGGGWGGRGRERGRGRGRGKGKGEAGGWLLSAEYQESDLIIRHFGGDLDTVDADDPISLPVRCTLVISVAESHKSKQGGYIWS